MSVLSLATAKADLGTGANDDEKLQGIIDSAEAVIARHVGPLTSVATTSRADGRGWSLSLPVSPVISLTSVVGNTGDVPAVSDLTVTTEGLVEYTLGQYYFPARWYTVVYQAGRTTVPTDLVLAIRKLTRHLWQDQRGPVRTRPGDPTSNDRIQGAGYLLPFQVEQLIERHISSAGFA